VNIISEKYKKIIGSGIFHKDEKEREGSHTPPSPIYTTEIERDVMKTELFEFLVEECKNKKLI
jgi:hypothetical protein